MKLIAQILMLVAWIGTCLYVGTYGLLWSLLVFFVPPLVLFAAFLTPMWPVMLVALAAAFIATALERRRERALTRKVEHALAKQGRCRDRHARLRPGSIGDAT